VDKECCCFACFGRYFDDDAAVANATALTPALACSCGDTTTGTQTVDDTTGHLPMLRAGLRTAMTSKLRAAIIVVSDTASKDALTDKCIPALREVFQQDGQDRWETAQTKIVADDVSAIQKAITGFTDGTDSVNLVVTSGGTGFAQKDVTPEVSSR
jgi:hypothetical protein